CHSPVRPSATAGALVRDAVRAARGDRECRSSLPRERARERERRGRPRARDARVARRQRGARECRCARGPMLRRDLLLRRRRRAGLDRVRQREWLRSVVGPRSRGRPPGTDGNARTSTWLRRRMRDHIRAGPRNEREAMDSALETTIEPGSCPHLAMLLAHRSEVAPTLASFYALGAKRNGWLFHRSLPGAADADRAALSAAGLDVAGLEAEGRMGFSEISLDISGDD